MPQPTAHGWKQGDLGMETATTLEISFTGPSSAYTVQPGSFGYFTMYPIAQDKTRVWCAVFTPKETLDAKSEDSLVRQIAAAANESANFTERVMDEDGLAMPGIHKALHSRLAEPGKMSWMEEPILRWYQWLARKLT